MIPERLKGWFASSSRFVASSARLAKKQAELATLNNVTLPRLYHAIGKRVIRSANLPADLVHHRQRIQDLEASIAAKPEQPKQDAAVGLAAKAKQFAKQAASTTVKATSDTASKVKIQAAYVALGKQAIETYGVQALPQELREQYESIRHKQVALSDEIGAIASTRSKKFFSYGRLAIIGTCLFLLLGFVGLRATGNWLFGESVQIKKVAAIAKPEGSPPSGLPRSSVSRQRSTANTFVDAVLGSTSHHYTKYGYKEVLLGQTFEEINSKRPLGCARAFQDGPHKFREFPDSADAFYFDENQRLICYSFTYSGGPRHYLSEIEQVFGEHSSGNDSRSSHSARLTSQNVRRWYTFPETVVFVDFGKSNNLLSTEEFTGVHVFDRQYLEGLLRPIAAARWQAGQWIGQASKCLKAGVNAAEQYPLLDGCRIETLVHLGSTGVAMFDKQYEGDPDTKALDMLGIKGRVAVVATSIIQSEPQIQFDFRYLTAGLPKTRLHRGTHERFSDILCYAREYLPYSGLLKGLMTAYILHEVFPSSDGTFRFVQTSNNGIHGRLGAYKWEHEDADGDRWAISCGENDFTQVVFQSRKKL